MDFRRGVWYKKTLTLRGRKNMMYDVNPKVDLAFKKIFGVEENKDLTISLLNSIVSKEDQVEDITFLNPYNIQNFDKDKLSVLDIKAKGHNGKLFNIEIQVAEEADYPKRALYYWSRLYSEQMKTGQAYGTLEKAIGIHILNFNCIDSATSDKYHHTFCPREKNLGFEFYEDMEIHTIELPKFEKEVADNLKDFVHKVKTSLDVWTTFLTKYDLLNPNELPKELNNPELKKALGVLGHINFDPQERGLYQERLDFIRLQTSVLKQRYIVGKEDGIKEGEARGIEKGKEEGIKEGKKLVAASLLQEGLAIATISKATGLKEEDILEIKNDQATLKAV